MTEDGGGASPPYVFDVSVLVAVARFDAAIMTLIQGYDSRGQALVAPAMALTGASLDVRSEDADDLLEGVERLDNTEVAPLRDAEQAVRLAAVIARTGLNPWDAHVAAVADASICPSSPWTRRSGGSMRTSLTSRCTTSRSPTLDRSSRHGGAGASPVCVQDKRHAPAALGAPAACGPRPAVTPMESRAIRCQVCNTASRGRQMAVVGKYVISVVQG